MANSSFAFWKFLAFLFTNVFYTWLVEYIDAAPMNTEEWLYATSSLFIHPLMGTWVVSISWLLWIWCNKHWNTYISLISCLIFFGYIAEEALLDNLVDPLLIFWGISLLFSIVIELIYIPINSTQGFPSLWILVTLVISHSWV